MENKKHKKDDRSKKQENKDSKKTKSKLEK